MTGITPSIGDCTAAIPHATLHALLEGRVSTTAPLTAELYFCGFGQAFVRYCIGTASDGDYHISEPILNIIINFEHWPVATLVRQIYRRLSVVIRKA